jgi:hypothetical protein
MLLVDEYFASADDRFLPELLSCRAEGALKALAARWYEDRRPWARASLLEYVDDGCDRPRHRALVKGLFKRAEAAADDEALVHFMAAFDRFAQRRLVEVKKYDWSTRKVRTEFVLQDDPAVVSRIRKAPAERKARNPQTGEPILLRVPVKEVERFSRRTRRYLSRRVFRYFRRLGRRDPERYGKTVRAALLLYQDDHLREPAQLLNAWSLVHVLYWGSSVLVRSPHGVRLAAGAALADLTPAPLYPQAWRGIFGEVLSLAERAASRTVRTFALAMLTRDYGAELGELAPGRLRQLLQSPYEEVQEFAARRLREARGLESLALAEWLTLLQVENLSVLPLVCELVEKHVHPDRLDLAQCVELACSPAAPVAELGLRWARGKPIRGAGDLRLLRAFAEARAPRVRAEGVAWLGDLLAESADTRPEDARELIDARHAEVRKAGLALVEKRFAEEPALWAALTETPYDDVRSHLVAKLGDWERRLDSSALRRVWATTLLAIHRGGRPKRAVVRQVADRIAERPEEADSLLPLLGIALRSVRAPERRAGLATLARAAYRRTELRGAIARLLPEVTLFDEVSA